MRGWRVGVLVVSVTSLFFGAADSQRLQLVFDPPGERKGNLDLAVRPAPTDFSGGFPCRADIVVLGGPANINSHDGSCEVVDGVLRTTTGVPFCRDYREPVQFRVTLTATDSQGARQQVGSKEDKVGPLGPQSGENPKVSPCKALPPSGDPLKLTIRDASKVLKKRPVHWVTLILEANQAGNVTVELEEAEGGTPQPKEFSVAKSANNRIEFDATLTAWSNVVIRDKASGELIARMALPRIAPWYTANERVSAAAALLFLAGCIVIVGLFLSLYWREVAGTSRRLAGKLGFPRKAKAGLSIVDQTRPPETPTIPPESPISGAGTAPTSPAASPEEKAPPLAAERRGEEERVVSQPPSGPAGGFLERENADLKQKLKTANQEMENLKALVSKAAPEMKPRVKVRSEEYEKALLATLTKWWQEGAEDRKKLIDLAEAIGLPAFFYAIKDIDQSRSFKWDGPYWFEPSAEDGGWLWCELPGGEGTALALPADPRYFKAQSAVNLLQRVLEGCGSLGGGKPPRFRRAVTPCRMAPVPDQRGRYKVLGKGAVVVEGSPQPMYAGSVVPSYESFFQQAEKAPAAVAPPPPAPPQWLPVVQSIADSIGRIADAYSRGAAPEVKPGAAAEESKVLLDGVATLERRIDELGSEVKELRTTMATIETSQAASMNRMRADLEKGIEQIRRLIPVSVPPRPPAAGAAAPPSLDTPVVGREVDEAGRKRIPEVASAPPQKVIEPAVVTAPPRPVVLPAPEAPRPASGPVAAGPTELNIPLLLGVYEKLGRDDSADYAKRLQRLADVLRSAFPKLDVSLAHLVVETSGHVNLHPARRTTDETKKLSCEGCAVTSEHQFFVVVRSAIGDDVLVLLPPGEFKKYSYPQGNMALIERPSPETDFTLANLTRPARLVRSGAGNGVFVVAEKMLGSSS